MKTFSWILHMALVTGLTFVVACSRPNSSPQNNTAAGDKTGSPGQNLGTGDGGGGNTCNGRPIESYVLDLKSTPAFKNHIQPVYDELTQRNDDLYRLFTFVIDNKNWYLIPCQLEKLPDNKIGSAVKTEQAAIQTFTEVWYYQPLVEKMAEADQAQLYWHEIFMGIKLLKLESSYNQCKAFAPDISLCDGTSKERKNKPSDLTVEDYADVRKAASDILKLPRPISQATWDDFLGRRNFSFGSRSFRRSDDTETVLFTDLVRNLSKIKTLGYFPKVGHLTDIEASGAVVEEQCTVELQPEGEDRLAVKILRSNGEVMSAVGSIGLKAELNKTDRFGKNLKYLAMGSPNAFSLRKGERMYLANLFFDSPDSLFAVSVQEHICHTEKKDESGQFSCEGTASPANAKLYICARERIKDEDLY